jgi:DNA polymerase III subunit gamma/tau
MEGRHVDVVEMDAASHTGIGDIREIIDSVRYAPVSARYKVYIIDEVHMLSTQAFNGLLKTLEEPPPHVKFIFATTEIRKVPVTVLSRCQRFDLRRIVRGLAEKFSPAQLSRLWQMLLKALEEAGKAPDPIAALEMAMVRLCAAQSLPPPEDAARLLRDGAISAPVNAGGVASGVHHGGSAAQRSLSQLAPDSSPASGGANGETSVGQDTPFSRFEDVIAKVAEERDIELELALERMKVTRFSALGDIEYLPAPDQPRDLVRRLKAFLEEHTPFEWRIRTAEERAAPVESLAERRKREEARALEELKRQPFVAEALKAFPGAEIVRVRNPADENAASGDVAPFPTRDMSAPSPARKKEV